MAPLIYLLLITVWFGNAEVRIMGLFGNHMVLQTPHPELGIHEPYIYGTALLNETVTITGSTGFPGPFKLTPVSNNVKEIYGNWSVGIDIDTTNSSFPGPYNISIISTNINGSKTGGIILSDVYFGEVILCAGQSNMQTTVAEGDSKQSEINIAKQFPNIRLIQVVTNNSFLPYQNNTGLMLVFFTKHPCTDNTDSTYNAISIGVYNNTWQIAGTKTPVGSDAVGTFSAACWMAGRRIAAYIMNNTQGYTPYLGLIESAIGGTTVHFWAPAYVGIACNTTHQLPNTGEAAEGEAGQLFNTMINPITFGGKGMSVRNILYYQGEADSGENDLMTQQAYECELFGLINGWRKEFNISNLVFINFQLPGHFGVNAYENDDGTGLTGWYAIQAAQNNVFKMVKNTGLVTAQDQGQNTLHYKHKTVVAERAYNWSRYLSFNDESVNPEGPRFNMAFKENANDLSVKIQLSNIGQDGLRLIEALNCSTFNNLTVYNYNATTYHCCDWNGINIVRLRLEGIYHYEQKGVSMVGIWNWMPGNVTNIENDLKNDVGYVTVEPILPQSGCIGWPNSGDKFLYSQTIAIKEIEVSTSSRCAIANSIGTPLSKGGPYQIAYDAYDQLPINILAMHQKTFKKYQ